MADLSSHRRGSGLFRQEILADHSTVPQGIPLYPAIFQYL